MEKPLALIIEDDLSSAKLYRRLFDVSGYRCQVCTTYVDAREALKETIPELVVLDMRLEHYDRGPELLAFIKTQPAYNDTRIVIITAYSKMIEQFNQQADLVILKPINARELLVHAEDFKVAE